MGFISSFIGSLVSVLFQVVSLIVLCNAMLLD